MFALTVSELVWGFLLLLLALATCILLLWLGTTPRDEDQP